MLQYLPATFVYSSCVTDRERTELDKVYMPFVLQNSHKQSRDASRVRTDYFEQTRQPWELFRTTMFHYFRTFVSDCLLSSGSYSVSFDVWFNYYVGGSAMVYHSHPETDFGLIYCLRNAGRKSTQFNTFSHEYVTMEDRYSKLESSSLHWDPNPGDYVFFPASLFHATQPTEVDGERITLIANIKMRKEDATEDFSLRLKEPKSAPKPS